MIKNDDLKPSQAFPQLDPNEKSKVLESFKKKLIYSGIEKHLVYEKQRDELFKSFDTASLEHRQKIDNLKDRLQLEPRIALEEVKSIHGFIEKIMNEQAYLYTNGIKVKKAKFEEACASQY